MAFRKELDRMWVPRVIGAFSKINVIEHNGEMAGIICGSADYIDCVYIKPEHRRKGLASVAVKERSGGREVAYTEQQRRSVKVLERSF